jgi:hypothetical protein
MSLLTIIQDATDTLGIPRPTAVVSSTAQQTRQLLGLANREGKTLARRYKWQVLTKEQTFAAVATIEQTNAIPSDFDRFVDESFFNRTEQREVRGPLNAQDWQLEISTVASTVVEAYRQRGNAVLITPVATAGDTYAFEYVSKNWCQSEAEDGQARWAVDSDTGILDEEVMTLGIVWRFKKMKGFDYAEEFRDYEMMVADLMMRDASKPRINMGTTGDLGAYRPYIADGNWNVS